MRNPLIFYGLVKILLFIWSMQYHMLQGQCTLYESAEELAFTLLHDELEQVGMVIR